MRCKATACDIYNLSENIKRARYHLLSFSRARSQFGEALNFLKPRGSTAETVPPEAGPTLPPASPENIQVWRMAVATAQLAQGLLLGKVNANLWQAAFFSVPGRRFSWPRDRHVVSSTY